MWCDGSSHKLVLEIRDLDVTSRHAPGDMLFVKESTTTPVVEGDGVSSVPAIGFKCAHSVPTLPPIVFVSHPYSDVLQWGGCRCSVTINSVQGEFGCRDCITCSRNRSRRLCEQDQIRNSSNSYKFLAYAANLQVQDTLISCVAVPLGM